MKLISLLIPCYNEEASLPTLFQALRDFINSHTNYLWQIILIDDGSKDRTLDLLKEAAATDSRFQYISLSRNFGKENAMTAGFDSARGDALIIMDADLQHPLETIPEMLQCWEEGYDDVYARRRNRAEEGWLRKKLSQAYYRILQKMTAKIDILPNAGDFRLLDRKCVDAIKGLRETQRYTKGMYSWIGFKKKEILFEAKERFAGKSSFNFRSLFNLAVEGITSFTIAPLRISTLIGLAVSALSFALMLFFLVKSLLYGDPVSGFPTLITVILFLGGVQLLSLGIIGEYLGRIFNETKNRPIYIVRESSIKEIEKKEK